jgi:hypothetical protein
MEINTLINMGSKILVTYGSILMSLIFLFAAGILWFRIKSVPTGLFFFGLLTTTLVSIGVRLIIEWRLFDTATEIQAVIMKLSVIGAIAFFVQTIGFLLYVFTIEEFKTDIDKS